MFKLHKINGLSNDVVNEDDDAKFRTALELLHAL